MTSISALNYVHKTGLFGNYENKNEENLLKVSEIKNMLIVQIFQYKNPTISFESINEISSYRSFLSFKIFLKKETLSIVFSTILKSFI